MTSEDEALLEEKPKKDGYEVESRITFKIYDMPTDLATTLIKRAQKEAGNKVWVLIKQLLERDAVSSRIDDIDQRLKKIEGATKCALEGDERNE